MNNNSLSPLRTALIGGLLAASLSGCSLPSGTATKTAAKVSGTFSEGEILQVLRTLNEGEIKQAQLATQNTQSEDVRETAEHIIQDHQQNNERIDSLAQATGIELEKSPLSRGLQAQADAIHDDLDDLTGTEFDCNFLEKQIELHQLALETVRNELQPDAKHQRVRELLNSTAPALEQHLQAAQSTQREMTECQTLSATADTSSEQASLN